MGDIKTKVTIAGLLVLGLWNVTKIPYYVGYGRDMNDDYNSRGIELSINLGHWVEGYRSNKMRTPPGNYLLVHMSLGLTILAMMILSLINSKWRKPYCVPFFYFCIVEGIHAVPASLINDSAFLRGLFMFACVGLVGTGLWGLQTKKNYDQDPVKAEKNLFLQYSFATIINSAAAVLETMNIVTAFKSKSETGTFSTYGEDPHPKFGNTLYDQFPEEIGRNVTFIFWLVAWFIWPLAILKIQKHNVKAD